GWLAATMIEARGLLGEAWEELYCAAPIWRFWLGDGVVAGGAIGLMMPSVDGVGRYFPLCLFAWGAEGGLEGPERCAYDGWFSAAEDFVLAALDEKAALVATVEQFDRLPVPRTLVGDARGAIRTTGLSGSAIAISLAPGDRRSESVWWTVGGGHHRPQAFAVPGLPAGSAFAGMVAASPGGA
ncbi:type VI secretion system-associated protein TagF, partial [Zavarzinia sp.]|uniref:type VI secretion system-associated protein TagF n=1 Tax=Zavarzinia sp. TaxID=2027920 RepID=UPI003564B9E9